MPPMINISFFDGGGVVVLLGMPVPSFLRLSGSVTGPSQGTNLPPHSGQTKFVLSASITYLFQFP